MWTLLRAAVVLVRGKEFDLGAKARAQIGLSALSRVILSALVSLNGRRETGGVRHAGNVGE